MFDIYFLPTMVSPSVPTGVVFVSTSFTFVLSRVTLVPTGVPFVPTVTTFVPSQGVPSPPPLLKSWCSTLYHKNCYIYAIVRKTDIGVIL